MGNRTRIKAGDNVKTQNTGIPPKLFSSNRSLSTERNDELIVTLSDAYENRRAQQVGEWERLYGNNVYQARFE